MKWNESDSGSHIECASDLVHGATHPTDLSDLSREFDLGPINPACDIVPPILGHYH
jgi:hypothetical protein